MNQRSPDAQDLTSVSHESDALSIGDLAFQVGLQVPTLRMWETRHGFPRSMRLASGHRRYPAETVDLVREVIRRRNAGVRLDVAIAEVTADSAAPASSVFTELRERHPHLTPTRIRKQTLLALTRAMEDECCARAQQPWLFGSFQQEQFYRQAEPRWQDLDRAARTTWVLAEFDSPQPERAGVVEVALPRTAPMTREWVLVCFARDFPGVLAAWELPGQKPCADHDRVFELVWSLEPAAVRDAARCAERVVSDAGHDTSELAVELLAPVAVTGGEMRHATGVFNRMIAYVDSLP